MDVLNCWRANQKRRTPYPQRAAFETVAERSGLPIPKVRVAFSKHRSRAEIVVWLSEHPGSIKALSDTDLEALIDRPESLSDLIFSALNKEEREVWHQARR